MIAWSNAFALTIAFEAIFLWSVRATTPAIREANQGRLALVFLGSNLITHPIVWQLSGSRWVAENPVTGTGLLEALAIMLEGMAYALGARVRWPLALALSLGANLLSCGLGLIILTP